MLWTWKAVVVMAPISLKRWIAVDGRRSTRDPELLLPDPIGKGGVDGSSAARYIQRALLHPYNAVLRASHPGWPGQSYVMGGLA